MAELGLMAHAGAIGFTNGTTSVADSLTMRRLLGYSTMLDKLLSNIAKTQLWQGW